MKKILTFLLVCIVAAGAFADFRWILDMDVNTNVFGTIIPTGRHAELYVKDISTGEMVLNTRDLLEGTGLLPRKSSLLFLPDDALTGAYVPSSTAFFNNPIVPLGWFWTDDSSMRLTMLWNGDNVESYVSTTANRLMTALINNTRTFHLLALQEQFILDEYWIKANTHAFTLYFGNRGFGGKTEGQVFQDFTDWSARVKTDGFGVNVPHEHGPINDTEGHMNFGGVDGGSFGQVVNGSNWSVFEVAYFAGSIKLDYLIPDLPFPLNIDLGFDMGRGVSIYNTDPDKMEGQTRMPGGGIRISGERVGGLVNFDVMYSLRGGDPTTEHTWDEEWNPNGDFQPDGLGQMTHVIGAYFSLPNAIPDFGVSLGYTGMFRTYEDFVFGLHNHNNEDLYRTIETKSPFFSGIDLRMRYTGIQDLRLTFNNNISFASVAEPTYNANGYDIVRRVGLDGSSNGIPRYHSQEWLAIYNSLAARLLISGRLQFFLEVVSKLGIITENNSDEDRAGGIEGLDSWGARVRTKHTMSAALYASHQFNGLILLEGGLSLYLDNNKTELSGFPPGVLGEHAPTSYSAGAIGFSVPIRLRFTW